MDETCLNVASWYGPARNIKEHQARDLVVLLDAYENSSGLAHAVLGDAVVSYLKRLRGWRSPYSFFRKTNVRGNWTLVSYHHRAQLCWEWALSISLGRAARGAFWKPWRWVGSRFGQTHIGIPYVFELRFHRQSYDWMVSGDAKQLIRMVRAYHRGEQEDAA